MSEEKRVLMCLERGHVEGGSTLVHQAFVDLPFAIDAAERLPSSHRFVLYGRRLYEYAQRHRSNAEKTHLAEFGFTGEFWVLRYFAVEVWGLEAREPVGDLYDDTDVRIILLAERDAVEKTATALFNAYNDQGPNPWQTFDGRPVPKWPELTDQVRAKWRAVAERVVL